MPKPKPNRKRKTSESSEEYIGPKTSRKRKISESSEEYIGPKTSRKRKRSETSDEYIGPKTSRNRKAPKTLSGNNVSKSSKKRKSSNLGNEIKNEGKLVATTQYELEIENLAEINNNIEIVKLTESLLDSDEEEDDSNWEDVSDIDDKRDGIVVNLNGEDFDPLWEMKKKKRDEQRQEREKRDNIHRTVLMALLGRLMYVNKLCDDDMIKGLALSCISDATSSCLGEKELFQVMTELDKQFQHVDNEDETGDVRAILSQAFSTKRVSSTWINVVYVAVMRSMGIEARLIGALYPGSRKIDAKGNEGVLCPPTVHKPSTRGKSTKPKKQKTVVTVPSRQPCKTVFTMEVLDSDKDKWIAFDGRNLESWNDSTEVTRQHQRFVYCVAVHRGGLLRDVAYKYDVHWATASRRSRMLEPLWRRILASFEAVETDRDRLELAILRDRLMAQGVPNSLADLKGHPIFALKSHLLKYEVLYPLDVAPFGVFRKEPVYLRDNVKLAHTRETWLKEAMSVKEGEIPCKRVKTMSSTRKCAEKGADPFVDLFGPWQVVDYIPPIAIDGCVPRNTFGNVDLFKPCMLPIGCTHLHLKDLDKTAAELEIDCAPAMIGWAFSKRNVSRPVYDGWIVCNEHVDILKTAWLESLKVKLAKQAEQREKIVLRRWAAFTRKILLRERLRLEYNF